MVRMIDAMQTLLGNSVTIDRNNGMAAGIEGCRRSLCLSCAVQHTLPDSVKCECRSLALQMHPQ